MSDLPTPICIGCDRHPGDMFEYRQAMREDEDDGPDFFSDEEVEDYVRWSEGTYNSTNGHFACTSCYVRMGMPTAAGGWKAP